MIQTDTELDLTVIEHLDFEPRCEVGDFDWCPHRGQERPAVWLGRSWCSGCGHPAVRMICGPCATLLRVRRVCCAHCDTEIVVEVTPL